MVDLQDRLSVEDLKQAERLRVLDEHIAAFRTSPLQAFADRPPWELTRDAVELVEQLLRRLGEGYAASAGIAVHRAAIIEEGASVKGPAIIGPDCFIAAGAYLRGGCWLEGACVLGPGAELKSSFVFKGAKLAHFNFVGDSILGRAVNLEAGAVIANYRNEAPAATISFMHKGARIETGAGKFGALVGDGVKIGANAVVAPGAFIAPGTVVPRLALLDQCET
jgi:UDP-N-acetylglucosamine diphosphorylase / glucose-1-phosphate thymidylyltransferase / UDP-N-acetylgalactosamine diphosphorylase / glucosamine-1-phosphate N-acetyltransferase / galactosamine-1-phosphate N-acetyltransferase